MKRNKKLKRDLKRYFTSIKKALICSYSMKLAFLAQFKINVTIFSEENNIDSIELIIKEFGTYEEISNNLYTDYDIEQLKKRAKRNSIYKALFILLVICFIILLIYFIIVILDAGAFTSITVGS